MVTTIFEDRKIFYSSLVGLTALSGMGLGLASHENAAPIILIGDNSYDIGGSSSSFCLMPRFGIELFHHLRVTFNYKLEEKANRHFNISVGVVFGGGRK